MPLEPGGSRLGLSCPGVAQHDSGGAARNEPGGQALEPRERAAARVEDMRVMEGAFLAGIEQRELLVAEDHSPQLVRGH